MSFNQLHRTKIKASSLVETVVAMTILLFILSLGFVMIARIDSNLNPLVLHKAYHVCQSIRINQNELLEDGQIIEKDGFIVHCQVIHESKDLRYIRLSVNNAREQCIYIMSYYTGNETSADQEI